MYKEYIDNILSTRGRFNVPYGEYKERHHIIPRCEGGEDIVENLIDLTAQEHYLAHKYLYEDNPNNFGLLTAWFRMCYKNGDQGKYEFIDEEEYANLRILYSKERSLKYSGENNPFYGKHHTKETKEKISRAKTNPSKETRKKLSEAQKKVDHSLQVQRMAEFNRTQRDYSTQGAKISATKHKKGIGNGREDKIKITNGVINKFVVPSEIKSYLLKGFYIVNEKQYKKYLMLKERDNKC